MKDLIASARPPVSFAVLPIVHLLDADNYPATLKARGYRGDLPKCLAIRQALRRLSAAAGTLQR